MADSISWHQGGQQLVSVGEIFVVIGDAYRAGDMTAAQGTMACVTMDPE